MRDLTKAIISLYPEAQWSLKGNDYADLDWLSTDIPKPSQEELENEMNRLHEIWLKNEIEIRIQKRISC